MINYDNIRFPIVIFSTARSGSSALAFGIHDQFKDIPAFYEPDRTSDEMNELLSHAEKSKEFLTKIHVFNLAKYPTWFVNYITQSSEPFKIKIRRRNVVEQAVSLYIEYYRKKWIYFRNESYPTDTIEINEILLDAAFKSILIQNQQMDDFNINVDLTLYYEDLTFAETSLDMTPKPENHNQILSAMEKIYNNYLTSK